MKKILILMIAGALLFTYSCKYGGGGKFTVSGTYRNADKLFPPGAGGKVSGKLFLVEVAYGKDQNPVALDSIKITDNTHSFQLSAKAKKEGIYELVFGDNLLALPIVNDASEIRVDADLSKKDDFYQVSGSEATQSLKGLIADFGKRNYKVEQAFDLMDSLKKINAPDSVLIAATNAKNNAIQDLNGFLQNFLNTSKNGTVSGLALSWASRSFSQQQFESALNHALSTYPVNDVLQSMKKSYDMQKAMAQQQAQQQGSASSWVGQQAPDLALPDMNGKIIPISSFKGKYLLVDFWASWCGPCRAENPNVVKAYSEFKNKNFAILGVSLDKDKDAWLQAIKEDNLTWTHVSDLKYWNSKAVDVFKFEGIPFNILIDPQGKIIGQELRGAELENKLKEVLQ